MQMHSVMMKKLQRGGASQIHWPRFGSSHQSLREHQQWSSIWQSLPLCPASFHTFKSWEKIWNEASTSSAPTNPCEQDGCYASACWNWVCFFFLCKQPETAWHLRERWALQVLCRPAHPETNNHQCLRAGGRMMGCHGKVTESGLPIMNLPWIWHEEGTWSLIKWNTLYIWWVLFFESTRVGWLIAMKPFWVTSPWQSTIGNLALNNTSGKMGLLWLSKLHPDTIKPNVLIHFH